MIADKDRIKVAKIDDRFITRGDLAAVIRDMSDEERPEIRNKGDLLGVLKEHLDASIRIPLGAERREELETKGAVSREIAVRIFLAKHVEDGYETIYRAEDGAALGIDDETLGHLQMEIDIGIDDEYEKLLGGAALALVATQRLADGSMMIEDAAYEQEYKLRKNELRKLEWMAFRAIRFPASAPRSEVEAAKVRRRLEAGEDFDQIAAEFLAINPQFVMESEIENNPDLARFKGFWMSASGSAVGEIIGPVYLPEYQMMAEAQGQTRSITMPEAYLVLKVLERRDETTLSLEEAKPRLVAPIAIGQMMRILRQEHGVEIYEDKLPDPTLLLGRPVRSTMDM